MKKIYTVQIAKQNLVEFTDITFVDITVKSGIEAFAPRWDMVMRYKSGELPWEGYVVEYTRLMEVSKSQWRDDWLRLKSLDNIALACYCRAGVPCHRHLLTDLLLKDFHVDGLEAVYMGELT